MDEATGRVVEVGDVAALAAAIQELLDGGSMRRSCGSERFEQFDGALRGSSGSSACRERAERLFDKNRCFEKYVELYARLVSQK